MSTSPTRMTDAQLFDVLGGTSPLNEARKIFRFRAAGMESARISPIEQRKQEFEAILAIVDVFYGRQIGSTSITDAIAMGSEKQPVCDKCSGKGFIYPEPAFGFECNPCSEISAASEAQRPAEATEERLG